jgi:hypothetical protein
MPTRCPARRPRLRFLAGLILAATGLPAAAQTPENRPALELLPPAPEQAPVTWNPGRSPLTVDQQTESPWGSFSGKQAIPGRDGAWEDPALKQAWQAEQAWRGPLVGPLSAFGQLGASGEERGQQDTKLAGRTGLAWTLANPFGAELLFRGGPSVTASDPLRPERTQAHTEMLFEVQGRAPLLAGVGLEYQGSAAPALSPLDHDRIQHDVRLAFPVGEAGKLKLGARHTWMGATESRPTPDATQLYLGLEWKR